VGVAVEMGRPGVGTRMRDIERLTRAMASMASSSNRTQPVTGLMSDPVRGILKEDVLNERVLSAIIEFKLPEEKLAVILPALKLVAETLDTVFSLGSSVSFPRTAPIRRPRGSSRSVSSCNQTEKVNLGLGRPLPNREQ